MTHRRKMLLVLLLTFGTVGCDQATKQMAVSHLRDAPGLTYLGGLLELRYAENAGGFLSFGASIPDAARFAVFTVGVGFLLLGMLAMALLSRKLRTWEVLALTALAAGGLSNWLDRVMNDGRVVDFMILQAGPLRTGVFNVADVVIMAAIPLWLLSARSRKQSHGDESPDAS